MSGEPVADLNYLLAGSRTTAARFNEAAQMCLDRDLPFLAMLLPSVADTLAGAAEDLGLVHAVEFPFMICETVPPALDLGDVAVRRVAGDADMQASAHVLHAAFGMQADAVLRAMPPALVHNPSLEIWLAELDGRAVGSVTLTYHGPTVGVWAMGVDSEIQRRGVGKQLLTRAMHAAADRGAERFFLGATPAGRPLYQRLGYETRVVAQVWAAGESGQT